MNAIDRAVAGRAQRGSGRRALAAVFSSCLGVGLIFGFQPPLIALTLSRLGNSSFAIGAVTAATLIAVLQVPIGLLADRYGRKTLLAICALTSCVGPLLPQRSLGSPLLLWPLLFVWGGTLYAFYSQGVALLGEEFAVQSLPSANTLFVMVYCVGGVIGPSVGGMVMDQWPSRGLPVLLSGAAALMLAGLLLDGTRRRRECAAPSPPAS